MDVFDKLNILGEGAQFEAVSTTSGARHKRSITPLSNGATALCVSGESHNRQSSSVNRQSKLMRVLQTNRCDQGCSYCPLRAQNDEVRRTTFAPDELAKLFLEFHSRGMADGMLLSSGADNGVDAAMEQVVKTAAVLREKFHFGGYLHLKVLPGTSFNLIEEAARLANRLSVNMEAPTAERLDALTPDKNFFSDIIMRMEWIEKLREERGWLSSGQSTQLIVGAGAETDREILKTTSWLYKDKNLSRVYYGAFTPAPGTPLEGLDAPSPRRQQRLYQTDWLLSEYGFSFEELPFTGEGSLPQNIDPKVAWALQHLDRFPIEINKADPEELLRVPGLGPVSVARIVNLRQYAPFKTLENLKKTGAATNRAQDFVTLEGRYFGAPHELLLKAGQRALQPRPTAKQGRSSATQLTLPFEWERENILPARLPATLADYGFD
jgi:predicted DNA-binding helix-hairpin-helix protein